MSEANNNRQPGVVLFGCPRSGTYLLAQYLQSALGIAMPLETHFIPQFAYWQRLWGDTSDPRRARQLLEAMAAYTRIWLHRGTRSRDVPAQYGISILPELDELAATTAGGTYAELLSRVFSAYARRQQCVLAGDKSAPFQPADPQAYALAIPDLRMLHIVRDGRDVALSWCEQWFGPRTLTEAALMWQRHVLQYRRWGVQHPQRYHELRYEDFVAEPRSVLGDIADFLGLPPPGPVDAAPDGELAARLSAESSHPRLGEALTRASAARWRNEMPAHVQHRFQTLIGETLAACGYEPGSRVASDPAPLAGVRSWAWLRAHFSFNYLRRQVRAMLPPMLRFVQCFRRLRGRP